MNAKTRQDLEDRYASEHAHVQALIQMLSDAIADKPAPDYEGLHWGHLGDLTQIASDLEELVRFARGS